MFGNYWGRKFLCREGEKFGVIDPRHQWSRTLISIAVRSSLARSSTYTKPQVNCSANKSNCLRLNTLGSSVAKVKSSSRKTKNNNCRNFFLTFSRVFSIARLCRAWMILGWITLWWLKLTESGKKNGEKVMRWWENAFFCFYYIELIGVCAGVMSSDEN